ncbi:MAG: hypothetical protein HYY23_09700 [Verrucomicrobia bacterium]|nr:hypothetical protein [Verrucomicrobiota bacterium]
MSTVEEIERVIEQLPREDFEKLADWIDQRRERHGNGLPDQKEAPAASKEYPTVKPADPQGAQWFSEIIALF